MHEKKPWHDGTFGVVADWAEHQSPTHPHHAMHGVNLWVDTTEHDPADNFTGRRASCPTALREPLGLGPPPDPAEDQDDPYGVPPPPDAPLDGPPEAHPGPGHDTEFDELDEHTR